MAVVNEKTSVPPKWMRFRWGWMGVAGFVILDAASGLKESTFPLMIAMFIAWALWRADRDSGKD